MAETKKINATVDLVKSGVEFKLNGGTILSDDGTSHYLHSQSNLYLYSGSSNTMVLTSSGNVGIGTTSPTYKFEVSNGTQTGTFNPNSSGFMFLGSTSNHPLYFGVNDSTKVAILSSGNVGIGTTSPSGSLHVYKSAGQANVIVDAGGNNAYFFANNGANWGLWGFQAQPFTLATNSSERFRITSDGNVGIGSTSPSDKLEVIGNIGIGSNMIYNGASSNSAALDFTGARANIYGYYGIHFYSSTAGVGGQTERMRITNTGLVGIGTTSPGAKLDITTDHTSQIPIRVTHNNYNDWLIQKRRSDDTQKLGIKEVNSNGGMGFATADAVRMIIDSSGNVGIGTSSPNIITSSVSTLSLGGTHATASGGISYQVNGSVKFYQYVDSDALFVHQGQSGVGQKFKVNGSEAMRITSSGNVGIGTTSPSTSLHVVKDASWEVARFEADSYPTATVYSQAAAKYAQLNIYDTRINSEPTMELRADTPHFNIRLDDTGNVLTIRDGGNVGIGTTSPGRQLELRGQGVIRLNAISGGDPGLDFNTSDVNDMQIRYRSTTDALAIYSYGTSSDVLTIRKSDGNVGIGTTSPSYKLDIAGDVQVQSAYFLRFANEWGIQQTGTNLNFAEIGSADGRLYLKAGGNVGIGTTAPNHRLDIYSNENVPLRVHRPSNANLDSSGAWGIGFSTRGDAITSTSDTRAGIFSYYNGNLFLAAANTSIVADPDAYARLTILNSGNVGIGTTSPAQKLEVSFAGSVYGARFTRNDATGSSLIEFANSAGVKSIVGYDAGVDGYRIGTSTANNLTVKQSGNVGIGTTAPSTKLQVSGGNGDTPATALFSIQKNEEGYGLFSGILGSGVSWLQSATKTQSSYYGLTLQPNGGNVGIGTTSPSYNLDVNGNINATGFYIGGINQIAGTEYIAPLARTGTWTRDAGTSPSDEWVKVISYNGGPRRIRLWLNHGGDNTNMYDEYLISHSSYGMQTHIYRLPGSKYNTSKVLGIKVINSSGAVQDVWVKLAGIASGSGSFVYRSNVTVESSTNVAASATATEPSGTTGSSVLYISDSNRNEFTTMSSGGGYFGGNISIGTASPTANLHITSSGTPIKMSRSGYDDYGFVQSAGTGLQIQNFTDNRTEMFFDGGGNVGIGTTSPSTKLHINTEDNPTTLSITRGGTNLSTSTSIGVVSFDADYSGSPTNYGYISLGSNNISGVRGSMNLAVKSTSGNVISGMTLYGTNAGVNVGIGNSTPGYKLEVEGAISAGTANSTSGSLILVGKYNNGNIITIGGGYGGGGAVIGYGVKPSTTAAGAFLSSSALANLERSAYVQYGSTHQWWAGAYQTVAVDSAATLSQVMTLDGAGNLGIGTTSPQSKLHVQSGAGIFNVSDDWQQSTYRTHLFRGGGFNNSISEESTAVKIFNGSAATGKTAGNYWGGIAFMHLDPEYSTWGTSFQGDHFWIGGRLIDTPSQERSALVFATNNVTTAGSHSSEKMVILPNGNVGIGTTSPGYNLTVDNDASNTNNAALYVRNPNSSSGAVIAEFVGDSDAIQIKNINVGDYVIYNTQQSNGIALYDGAGGVEIHYAGVAVLEADSTGGIKVTGQLSATGDVVAYSSDERLKENIKPIENAVDKIKQLKGVTFDWNEKSQELGFEPSTKTNDVGVIAQDVEAVFPQLVHLAPFDIGSDEEGRATSKTGEDYKTVNYARLTAVLIEAVKEQQQQIDELKEIINGLTK